MVEGRLKKAVKAAGGIEYKFTSPGTTGVPDRLVVLGGRCAFVETKRPKGGVTSDRQRYELSRLTKQGIRCYILKDPDRVDDVIQDIQTGSRPGVRYVAEF